MEWRAGETSPAVDEMDETEVEAELWKEFKSIVDKLGQDKDTVLEYALKKYLRHLEAKWKQKVS